MANWEALWTPAFTYTFDISQIQEPLKFMATLCTLARLSSHRVSEPSNYQRTERSKWLRDGTPHRSQHSLARMKSSITAVSAIMVRGGIRDTLIVKYVSILVVMDVVTLLCAVGNETDTLARIIRARVANCGDRFVIGYWNA